MENENKKDNIEVQENEPVKAEKLFTQEEVNEIIRKRLAKEKAKEAPAIDVAELTARSNRLDCKEYIIDNGLSMDLLDIIDTSDVAVFKEKAAKIVTVVNNAVPAYPTVKDGGENLKPLNTEDEAIRKAFSKKGTVHKPKNYEPSGDAIFRSRKG